MFEANAGSLINGVKLTKDELLHNVRENLDKHKVDVAEALSLRRGTIAKTFANLLEEMEFDVDFQPKEHLSFPMPKDHSEDYKKAIRMIEMTTDEVIELTESQFDKLVMDNWGWKSDLIATSSVYGKKI